MGGYCMLYTANKAVIVFSVRVQQNEDSFHAAQTL